MKEEEIKKLREKAESYKDACRNFISRTNPQIDGFKNSYRKYYEYIITACGVFAGLTEALLASNFQKIDGLAILGFIFFVLAVIIAFLGFKKGIIFGAKYTVGLKGMHKNFSDFSYEITKFLKNEISPEEYKSKQEDFENKRLEMRNNADMKKSDLYEDSLLEEIINNPLSKINLITITFLLGLIFVALSVVLPKFTCLYF